MCELVSRVQMDLSLPGSVYGLNQLFLPAALCTIINYKSITGMNKGIRWILQNFLRLA